MLKELSTLSPFFNDPSKVYSARELSKIVGTNHVTLAKYLKSVPFIKREKFGPYLGFKAVLTEEFVLLRKVYNEFLLYDSGLVSELRKFYDEPTIIFFGSFSTASNTPESDIDLAIVSSHKKQINLASFEKFLAHKIQLFVYSKDEILKMKKNQPELLNNLCNGRILNGELEVFF
jgi:predicted nucleotidyltransferase